MANTDEAPSSHSDKISSPPVISPIKRVFSDLLLGVKNAFFRGVSWAASYTMPEAFSSNEEKTDTSNHPRYHVTDIFSFPLTFIGACVGLTVLPLVYYSLYEAFPYFITVPSRWLYHDKMQWINWLDSFGPKPRSQVNIFSIPGIALGLAMSSLLFVGFLTKRIFESTYRVNHRLFTFIIYQMNAFIDQKPLKRHPFDGDDYSFSSLEVILGLLPGGWIPAALIITTVFCVVGLKLLGQHCAISFYRSFAHTTNAGMSDMFTLKANIKTPYQLVPLENGKETRNGRQLIIGLIGRFAGLILGLAAFITIIIARVIQNIPEHVFRIFCRSVRFMLSEKTPTHALFTLKPDKRAEENAGYGLSYALGIFGIFPLGIVSGILGLLVGGGLRAGIEIGFLLRGGSIAIEQLSGNLDEENVELNETKFASSYGNAMGPLNSASHQQITSVTTSTTTTPSKPIEQPSQKQPRDYKSFFSPISIKSAISVICPCFTLNNKTW